MGGSYGGCGGYNNCTKITNVANLSFSYEYVYYSTIDSPIGSSVVSVDTPKSYEPTDTSVIYGSGGGVFNDTDSNQIRGGRGGGSIQLYCRSGTITLNGAVLSADGGVPGVDENFDGNYAGSGSGGSVVISASTLSVESGSISVAGGDSMYSSSGAGGGGRIYVSLLEDGNAISNLDIDLSGGMPLYNPGNVLYFCLAASGGTLYTDVAGVGTLYISNGNQTSSAVTLLDVTTSDTTSTLSISGNSAVYLNTTLTVPSVYIYDGTALDAYIGLYPNNTFDVVSTSLLVEANTINVANNGALFAARHTVRIECSSMTVDKTSVIKFSNLMNISASNSLVSEGTLMQLESSFVALPPNSLVGLLLYSNGTISLADTSALGIVVYSGSFTVASNASVAALDPSVYYYAARNYGSCQFDVPASDVDCEESAMTTEILTRLLLNSSIVVSANTQIYLDGSAEISGNFVLICTQNLYVIDNSAIRADYGGCLANTGRGAGTAPGPSANEGGGGGGHSGSGGYGTEAVPGGIAYTDISGNESLYVSAGSGGGCLNVGSAATDVCNGFSSSGGGIVSLQVPGSIQLEGDITARGMPGAPGSNSGGGAGGAIAISTGSLTGYVDLLVCVLCIDYVSFIGSRTL